MIVLAYKENEFVADDTNGILKKFEVFLQENKYLVDKDVTIAFSIFPMTKRAGKYINTNALKWLLSASNAVTSFEVGNIKLDFVEQVFTKEQNGVYHGIYLTAQEQLVLYQKCVLKFPVDIIDGWPQIAYALRKKFGTKFVDMICSIT